MLPNVEILLRLLCAAALGSIIGFERERLLWTAGIRTHMLVCVGACLIMIVSAYGFSETLAHSMSFSILRGLRRKWSQASAFSARVQSWRAARLFED